MQQLLNVWTGLELRRQIVVIGATAAMFLAVLTMSRIATGPNMTLLYAGLENGAAGEVVRALEQRGVPFEVRGGSIFVDSADRDQLRMTLASEGLPANGSRGYELLDSLSGFGTTSQMFDAAYWRAKEGELARTIVSSPHIAMARVHIAAAASNPFQRGTPPKASVAITPTGGALTAQQAKAVRYLVSSAVSGLAPEDVAVIDANGALVGPAEDAAPAGNDDKAQVLRERVERLLEARVGFGQAVVEVSVDTVNEAEEIRERRFDPEGRVAISTDTEERTNSSNQAGGGDVTVASNLPDENGNGGADNASSQNSETRERVNYEVSETERSVVRAPGAIKRLTVAVLVSDIPSETETGATEWTPRPDEELQALQELVSSAVGFDEARGDVITIKSMPLQSVIPQGTQATTTFMDRVNINVMSAIQMAVLAIVTLILGLFVVRPLLSRAPADEAQIGTSLLGAENAAGSAPQLPPALSGEITDGNRGQQGGVVGEELPSLTELPDAQFGNAVSDDPVDRLRSMIGERQEETVEILRGWLEEKEGTN
ncbi:MAG: flagellar basal-body MS-ring/collar protein FliF [Pseudomonadota bacterium]